MRPEIVQRAAVLLHFDPGFAEALHDRERPLPGWLAPDEAALLRRADPRAFRTDPERALRLLAALLEEYPVSCALLGREALPAFISSSLFHNAVVRGRLVVDAFGDWLLPRAGGAAQLEHAIALARRRRRRRGAGIARAPGVELVRVPAGTLRFYAEARRQLGPSPRDAVAHGARLESAPDMEGLEELLVEQGPVRGPALAEERLEALEALEAGPSVAPCAAALFSLLSFAREGRPRDLLVDEARRLGADDEAHEVVTELIDAGLLAPTGR